MTRPYRQRDTVEQRFWAKVRKRRNGCWEWVAAITVQGYGAFTVKSRYTRAHRYAWELQNGPIPEGLCICHRCDNRRCVNPTHLFLGTYRDNVRDCHAKGRGRDQKGEKNNMAKLTTNEVRMIRKLRERNCPVSQVRLAEWFRVDPSLISHILRRKEWTHVA